MQTAEVISRLRFLEPQLRAYGVAGLYLFGSYARNEAGPDSDVDVFIDRAPGTELDVEVFVGAYDVLKAACPSTSTMAPERVSPSLSGMTWNARPSAFSDGAQQNALIRLLHIIDEAEAINRALAGISSMSFSWVLQRAVEHGLLIISEASKTLPAELKEAAPDIAWRKIETLRNFLRHEYRDVDPDLI